MLSVEDEWERKLKSKVDLDLLFVTFDPRKISIEEMQKAIAKHRFKFKAEIRDDTKK